MPWSIPADGVMGSQRHRAAAGCLSFFYPREMCDKVTGFVRSMMLLLGALALFMGARPATALVLTADSRWQGEGRRMGYE